MVLQNQAFSCLDDSGEEMPEAVKAVQSKINDANENLTGVIKLHGDHWEMFHANGRWTRNLVLGDLKSK